MPQLYRRKGGEILVNTETANNQASPSNAVLAGGGFIVAWQDASNTGADTSVSAIRAQRFDADGNKVGGEYLVNSTVSGSQGQPIVAALPSGRFVVTWADLSMSGGDTDGFASRAQLFEADGTPVGGEILVNTQTAGNQQVPMVTELAGGGFVITWSDASGVGGDASVSGIKMQLFDSAGARVGGEILVNSVTSGSQTSPSIAALASGGFAIAWTGAASGGGGSVFGSIRYQIFDGAGAPVGGELIASTTATGGFSLPNITALGTGFLVTWQHSASPADGNLLEIKGQRFDAAGAKLGVEFTVNTTTAGNQRNPDGHALPGGGFIVTWAGDADSGTNVYGQVYDAAGARVGVEFVLSTNNGGNQLLPRVDVLPSGDLLVTWIDGSGVGGDSSGSAVKAQLLTLSTDAPTDIALSYASVSETAIGNNPIATLSAIGAINTSFTYTIVSDSSGGAFQIDGDKLVVGDNSLLDFETQPSVDVRIRATDLNGNSYEETMTLSVTDAAIEARWSGGEIFAPNTNSFGFNGPVAIVALASGGFLIVSSWFQIGFGDGLRGQIFDAAGAKVGAEFDFDIIERSTFGVAAAGLPSGGFVLAYESIDAFSGEFPIRVQRFDAVGQEVGAELRVSTNNGILQAPSVAVLNSGNFVVTWTLDVDEAGAPFGSQIAAQMVDAAGNKLGGEFRVNTGIAGGQGHSKVVALPTGGFLVIWADSDSSGIEGQRFDAAGNKVGGELAILSGATNPVDQPEVAVLASGGFVVTWRETLIEDVVSLIGMMAQIVGADGVNVGGPLLLAPALTAGDGLEQHVAGLPGGGFVLSWSSMTPETGDDVDYTDSWAQFFSATGAPVGDPFIVSLAAGDGQRNADIAVLGSGDVVFTWDYEFVENNAAITDMSARIFSLLDDSSDIIGTPGPDTLTGTAGADHIYGLAGNDLLSGGAGDDLMDGGADNDTYIIENAGDVIVEAANEGFDIVFSSVSYTLGAGVDVEVLSARVWEATDAIDLTGNEIVNTLIGNAGANRLHGGGGNDIINGREGDDVLFGDAGADTLNGGTGNDIYVVEDSGDAVFENAGEGSADVIFSAVSYTLPEGSEIEVLSARFWEDTNALNLTGSSTANTLIGNAGANVLDGGGGNDVMSGREGNDTYVVDSAGDAVNEVASQGFDVVFSSVSFTLGAGSEVEVLSARFWEATTAIALTGNELVNTIIGNAGANILHGGGGNDIINGREGDDVLWGDAGADTMNGGQGNDIYVVEDSGDAVFENANEGSADVIFSAVSYTLPEGSEIEILSARFWEDVTNINLTGSSTANTLIGNAGNNILDGGGGVDTMSGREGNDTYVVDNVGDVVTELSSQGTDILLSFVSYTLAADSEIEILSARFWEDTTSISLTGNGIANNVIGNAGANILDGRGAADTLTGNAGADAFRFSTALGNGNIDTITDFSAADDTIQLDHAVFTGLGLGALNANAFVIGTTALDADDRILYNSATGALYYDADGNGAGAAVQFAALQGAPIISASDFQVI